MNQRLYDIREYRPDSQVSRRFHATSATEALAMATAKNYACPIASLADPKDNDTEMYRLSAIDAELQRKQEAGNRYHMAMDKIFNQNKEQV